MPDYDHPILVFPAPAQAERTRRAGGGGRPNIPKASQQGERLAPQFRRLQEALAQRRIALQDNSLGLEPEQVLVIETVGPISNFIRSIEKVKGLEWLGEYELDDIPPGDGFEDERDPDKPLKGQLFLVMSDTQALNQLRSLFDSWRENPNVPFERGLAPLKHAFEHLHAIRHWDVEDRLHETGLLEDWQERLEHGQERVGFEAELWFRTSHPRRRLAELQLRQHVETLGGRIISQCVIPEIAYHAILGRIDITRIEDLLEQPESRAEISLFRCDDIMFMRPVGQCAFPIGDEAEGQDEDESDSSRESHWTSPAHRSPVIALLDGLPLTRHRLLDGRVMVDDPDDYEAEYQAHERVHGTSMASLICHDDLDSNKVALSTPIYVRPILKPRRGFDGQFHEAIPEDVLPTDIVHRAVVRLFDGEGDEPPVSPSVRIVNLSIGDPQRPFVREMSSWARLLDWLAWKYNVLFLVSAGNHLGDIALNVSLAAFPYTSVDHRQRLLISAVAADTRNRRLLSPAETLNGLTVGALHEDASGVAPSHLIDPVNRGLPSVVSAHGPGYRRAIKPDLLLPGGRQLLSEHPSSTSNTVTLRPFLSSSKPGQRVATPGRAGALNEVLYCSGTSNAAALASRGAHLFHELVGTLQYSSGVPIPDEYHVVLIKALLVHGSDWGGAFLVYRDALQHAKSHHTLRDHVARFLGYGPVDFARVMTCTEQRVTVLGFGKLSDGEGAEFALPLPPSLSSVNEKRRLTITLAWMSPINSRRQNYRVAHLWFNPRSNLAKNRKWADFRAVQRGTVQHEVLEGSEAVDFRDGDDMVIKVNCRNDAGEILEPIRFGLIVTLEVSEDSLLSVPIYEEVRERLSIRVRPGARTP